ncbi:uncharacterized protein LOC112694947 [Athalia rosae]|uniref:uncharacterized protein LOC112694947 n=1 Tax=Athalia rosae TaxID=37344 RepID=UPI0020346E65|nr:uncharacterized protein LOC112694947 [Athalia rosae]
MLATAEQTKCEYCQENHFINRCERFGELSTQDKWNEVHRLRLCGNCLKKGHISKDCKGGDCRTQVACNTQESSTSQATEEKENRPPEKMTVAHCAKQLNSRVVLSTAQVYVYDIEDKPIRCRALLDPGSQLNLVTQELAQKLKLPLKRIDIPLSGISQSSVKVQYSVTIELESLTSKFNNKQDYLILPRITERLPQVELDISSFNIPDGILLADPDFNVPGDIDMLIGAGLFWKLLCAGQVLQPKGQPVLHKTLLGWIVGGEQVIKNPSQVIKNVCNLNVISTVEENIERLWKMEELPMARQLIAEERYCEEQFNDTHTRNEAGRFKVRLPQNPDEQLGNSEKEATRKYYALAERLKNNPELKKDYMEFLNEYEEAGHMSRIKVKDKGEEICYYLPHHPVIRAESSTTKVRVVFDGSAKTSPQTSLNDRLLPGPNLQEEIINIILRFRMHKFVITADIAQMFRQVKVAEQDRNLQRIIWRKDGDQNLRIYELNTVTYGTACAPYLAMRCLKQLALDDSEKYPRAATALTRDFYMDDVLTGSKSLEDTIELQNQLTQLLKAGHFELRKWQTNDTRVLEHLADECKAKKLLVLDKQEAVKTLGLLWDNTKDILKFNLTIKKMPKITKRTILSTISEIYDPIGFIGLVIMQAKVLLQELWIWKIAWDEAVPASIETTWNNYYGTLGELNRLEITRNVNPRNGAAYVLLHGFGDASEKGYGACIYALSYNENGEASCLLVSSKSRVAPLKKITLPRLELCAAWLLAKLLNSVVKALGEEQIKDVVLWSDSTIVLHWLRTPPNQLKTFVANRVAEIQELAKTCEWKHVPTKDNPADILSRGVTADQLIRNKLWWHGPAWLPYKAEWPKQKIDFINPVPEQRAAVMLITINPMINIFSKYSSFNKVTRIIAYCLRFVRYSRKRGIKGPLIVEELIRSEKTIIRIIQQEGFPEEVQTLNTLTRSTCVACCSLLHIIVAIALICNSSSQALVPE